MNNTLEYNIEVNAALKEEVELIVNDIGISMSDAINMFLYQVVINQGMPFEIGDMTPKSIDSN